MPIARAAVWNTRVIIATFVAGSVLFAACGEKASVIAPSGLTPANLNNAPADAHTVSVAALTVVSFPVK